MKRYVVLAITILVLALIVLVAEAKTGVFSKIFNKVGLSSLITPNVKES